jgi:signal transduction histidine kinase
MNQSCTILIVDDHPTNLKLLRVMLEGEGFKILQAADGLEALAVLERENVNAVISDILMPRMDGYRLCLELRKREKGKTLPVIIYTSTYTSPGDEKCALDAGADRYIRKPAPVQTMLDALNELLKTPPGPPIQPVSIPAELEVMKEYSEALIRKLEEKNKELERAKAEITKANEDLERHVHERTAELEDANTELEAFSRSVAHDLRNPLSIILGFAHLLERNCGYKLDEAEAKFLRKITESSSRMEALIVDLLKLSQGKRAEMRRGPVDVSVIAHEILQKLQEISPGRTVQVVIAPDVVVDADAPLVRIALENLLGNAWKFTGKKKDARIEFGVERHDVQPFCFVRDNGAGFDMARAEKLFGAFQRLHSLDEFPGTGIGLTTVQRIIRRHGGRIWADSAVGKGTTFYFTLKSREASR